MKATVGGTHQSLLEKVLGGATTLVFFLMKVSLYFPKDVPKLSVTQCCSSTFHCSDFTCHNELAHTPASQESVRPRGSPEKWESTSLRDSASDPDKGLDDMSGNLDQHMLGSETNSESSAQNSAAPSQDVLERSAETGSTVEVPSSEIRPGKGTERPVTPSMVR